MLAGMTLPDVVLWADRRTIDYSVEAPNAYGVSMTVQHLGLVEYWPDIGQHCRVIR